MALVARRAANNILSPALCIEKKHEMCYNAGQDKVSLRCRFPKQVCVCSFVRSFVRSFVSLDLSFNGTSTQSKLYRAKHYQTRMNRGITKIAKDMFISSR